MYGILKGLRVIEVSSFVASPTAGLYLAQLGAEVIRVDSIGGGADFNRWPKDDNNASFYWEGLNKGKKSVALNLATDEGRQLIRDLVSAPGENAGILLTNLPVGGFLSYENLKQDREDVIVARVMGQANGGPALDYTVNCALGYPFMTGPEELGDQPVNQTVPAWDLLAGAYTAFSVLAADKKRVETKVGGEYKIPLADIGVTAMANMGQLAEVLYEDKSRARYGNEVYGAFGRDFTTADGKRLMLLAITPKQWHGLLQVLDIEAEVAAIECARGVSFRKDEGVRFEHREVLYPLVEAKVSQWNGDKLKEALDNVRSCWGEYQTMREAADDSALVRDNPIFTEMKNPSGFTYPTPGSALTIEAETRLEPKVAPRLGEHSRPVLKSILGLSDEQISNYIAQGVVAADD